MQELLMISVLPWVAHCVTQEQIGRFELVRMAFFLLKLRKLELQDGSQEREFERVLLRNAIFQQYVSLRTLGLSEQAHQLFQTDHCALRPC
ncbi:hypothetical protein [Tengunoibacter tsumagoiensis]|uniref:Uncharacterized protein n=1 Tax=Tengunoibacter tsumagoiensis TaxID=2014871 RepID=A0A401ZW23_9CHLR|nr:hypothetical protein [Tengunoibacter tsumagoiensis]GCE10996.1 hypothetical protein KTT_08550 [Tengunoibacter tsumagoiensis]